MMITVLTDTAEATVDGSPAGSDLWIDAADLEAVSGWVLKPEGLCQGEVCVPVPPQGRDELVRDGRVNAAGFWRRLGKPVVATDDGSHWFLGASATDRAEQLVSLRAPDFTLPDVDGKLHSLSEHRGKKVFLATWASW